jgi:hypothetical protein
MSAELTLSERSRLFERISVGGFDACWHWLGWTDPSGYGRFWIQGTNQRVHRFVYELFRGSVTSDLMCHHVCENPSCVNPRHMTPVTRGEHLAAHDYKAVRTLAKQRSEATHCKRGHEFSPENTHRGADGKRKCLTCKRARERAAWPARRERRTR